MLYPEVLDSTGPLEHTMSCSEELVQAWIRPNWAKTSEAHEGAWLLALDECSQSSSPDVHQSDPACSTEHDPRRADGRLSYHVAPRWAWHSLKRVPVQAARHL